MVDYLMNNAAYYYYSLYETVFNVNEADEIIPNLFIGDIVAGNSLEFIARHKIKTVINLSNMVFPQSQEDIESIGTNIINISVRDSPADSEILYSYCHLLVREIHKGLINNQAVLVNCYAGRQRSAAIVACYLLKYINIPRHKNTIITHVDKSISEIQQKRPNTFTPKPNFYNVLVKYGNDIYNESKKNIIITNVPKITN
jgi:protein-tyrosine phosphatase